jgi:Terminase large subunit, T4likevirus-type, N-terminal
VNILDACLDAAVFGSAFRQPETWAAWRVFLSALFALPMDAEQLALYRECTGRQEPPTERATEGWLVCGRRSGKSFTLALIAVFLACFRDWHPYLNVGERGIVMVVAQDRKQARVIVRYVRGLLAMVPMLARTIEAERQDGVDLSNRITIEVHSCSFRTTRGYTCVAALLDEAAIWRGEETANPDAEVLAAIRPSMATVPGAMLLCASSPYARKGVLWENYHKHFGQPGPILVWQAPTRRMNPTVFAASNEKGFMYVNARFQNRVEKLTGIENFFPHAIRHTVETRLAKLQVCVHHLFSDQPLHQHRFGAGHDDPRLAELVSDVVGFTGTIVTDPSKPDGTPRKLMDVSRLFDSGWRPKYGLKEGLGRRMPGIATTSKTRG